MVGEVGEEEVDPQEEDSAGVGPIPPPPKKGDSGSPVGERDDGDGKGGTGNGCWDGSFGLAVDRRRTSVPVSAGLGAVGEMGGPPPPPPPTAASVDVEGGASCNVS